MKKKSPVYITGHRHPDTDSIASSIAYAFFQKINGDPGDPLPSWFIEFGDGISTEAVRL